MAGISGTVLQTQAPSEPIPIFHQANTFENVIQPKRPSWPSSSPLMYRSLVPTSATTTNPSLNPSPLPSAIPTHHPALQKPLARKSFFKSFLFSVIGSNCESFY